MLCGVAMFATDHAIRTDDLARALEERGEPAEPVAGRPDGSFFMVGSAMHFVVTLTVLVSTTGAVLARPKPLDPEDAEEPARAIVKAARR